MFFLLIEAILFDFALGILAIIAYRIYTAYQRLTKPSNYILATEKLGFTGYDGDRGRQVSAEKQQEALLQIFHLAGYFTLSSLWRDLNCLGNINNREKAFQEIATVVKYSRADQPDPSKFDVRYMRRNLFKSDTLDLQDAMDLILYMGQHAFTRKIGEERYELRTPDWIVNYAKEFDEAARSLELMERKEPLLTEYDGVWIAGASRLSLLQRIIDFNNHVVLGKIKVIGETLVLAGERELWANIDGIDPILKEKLVEASRNNVDIDAIPLLSSANDDSLLINEGQSHMKYLADFYNIKLNPSEPFIHYKTRPECPLDRWPNRIYANYDPNEPLKLTETLMSHDLLRTFVDHSASQMHIIDTLAEQTNRPNTTSTARDAAERVVKRILAGDYGEKKTFVILFWTNNPYIERQTLATQRQVNQVLEKYNLKTKSYHIQIEGVGYSCKQPPIVVHSEIGSLLSEKWRNAVVEMEQSLRWKPKRTLTDLLSQSRNHDVIVPKQPEIQYKHWNNLIHTWFECYFTSWK